MCQWNFSGAIPPERGDKKTLISGIFKSSSNMGNSILTNNSILKIKALNWIMFLSPMRFKMMWLSTPVGISENRWLPAIYRYYYTYTVKYLIKYPKVGKIKKSQLSAPLKTAGVVQSTTIYCKFNWWIQ